MNRKNLTILIFAIIVLLGTIFFVQEKKQIAKERERQRQVEVKKEEERKIAEQKVQEEKEAEQKMVEEEMQKLKNDPELVWYEVPELGVKFRVGNDARSDLGYSIAIIKEFDYVSACFFSSSEREFIKKNSKLKKAKSSDDCSSFVLSRVNKKSNDKYRNTHGEVSLCDNYLGRKVVIDNSEFLFCFALPQASNFDSKEQYDSYKETMKDRDLNIFIETIQTID